MAQVVASEHGKVFSASDELLVADTAEAFAEAQEVDGIEQIAFAHAVVAQEAVDIGGEVKGALADVLEVSQM